MTELETQPTLLVGDQRDDLPPYMKPYRTATSQEPITYAITGTCSTLTTLGYDMAIHAQSLRLQLFLIIIGSSLFNSN